MFLTAEEKKAKVEAFRNASLEDFLAALSFVITHRVGSALGRDEEMKLADPLVRILVGEALPDLRNGLYVNFPCQEMDNFVVAMFEVLPGDAECAADATELVEYGALQDFNDLISSDI